MSTDSELSIQRERYVDYKGFKLIRPLAGNYFWSVVDNADKELGGQFTDKRNIEQAIDLYLKKKEELRNDGIPKRRH
jgi:hypothetical protein